MTDQKRYSLSDSDMLGINEAIDNAMSARAIFHASTIGTWNAVLTQEGFDGLRDYVTKGNTLNVMAFAIPTDQAGEIVERMLKRALAIGLDNLDATNILMDFIDNRPSVY